MNPELLREKLRVAWEEVGDDYRKKLLNSERCLQANLYGHLRGHLCEATDILVEPVIDLTVMGQTKKIIPDLVVNQGGQVAVVLEIKFMPHSYAVFEDDLKKFALLAGHQPENIPMRIEPSSGQWADAQPSIDDETLYIFAVVTSHDSAALDAAKLASLMGEYSHQFGLLGGSVGGAENCEERARPCIHLWAA